MPPIPSGFKTFVASFEKGKWFEMVSNMKVDGFVGTDLMMRSPSVSRIRAKMLYATSKDRFRRELDGIHYEIQATDPSEMDLDVLRERAH